MFTSDKTVGVEINNHILAKIIAGFGAPLLFDCVTILVEFAAQLLCAVFFTFHGNSSITY